jgi:hypothetical protein
VKVFIAMRNACKPGAILVLFCLAGGCSSRPADMPDLGTVSGTVTIDGKPASDVLVRFSPEDGGRPSSGATDKNGFYRLNYSVAAPGAKVGMHSVSIVSSVPIDTSDPQAMMNPPPGNVPEKYQKMKKQIEVKAGRNTIDLTYP